jgi:hypothetical protein
MNRLRALLILLVIFAVTILASYSGREGAACARCKLPTRLRYYRRNTICDFRINALNCSRHIVAWCSAA